MAQPAVDTAQLRQDLDVIAPHFDEAFYRAQGPDLTPADGDAALHFLLWGWRQGLDPSPAFDTAFYLDTYPDVAAAGINPLVHYLRWGAWAGRLPRPRPPGQETVPPGPGTPGWVPVLPTDEQLAEARRLTDGHFDEAFYRAQGPDLTPAGGDALLHYLVWGWRQGLSPSPTPYVDEAFYREAYPDIAASDASPLLHYLRWGAWAGRLPRPRPPGQETVPPGPGTPGWVPVLPTDEQLAEARRLTDGHFDEAFYRAQGPDLTPAGGDALLHFLVWGWRQGLNPSPAFDVAFYRKNYPDIAATDFNPLMHYLWFGMRNGLLPRSSTNPWRSQLDQARSGGARAADAAPAEVPEPVGAGALTAALGRSAAAHGLALVLSHDDHTRTAGGVQNAVGDEEAGFRAAGWGHLHVRPLRTVPVLADAVPQDEAIVQLRLDGRPLGAARVSDLVAAVGAMRMRGHAVRIVVHHFAGHAPEHVQALALAAGTAPPVVWVHDFFTLCTSYALMRNDVAFCNAPPADSPACAICCYGPERAEHVARLQRFFAGTLPVVLAPSESALEVWRRMGFDHARSAVVPLARLRLDDPGPRPWRAPGAPARPIRVAHLGTRSFLKGWAVFDALATRYGGGHGGGEAGGGRYAFYQFGLPHGLPPSGAVHAVPVQVHANDREAMARAVAEHEIDVVVIWSLCQETFCFTVHEALAGGAFVVARAEAGNVWPAVLANAPDQGCAVRSEADLVALFDGDALPDLLARPRAGGRLDFGQGTVDWFRAQEDLRG